MTRPIVTSNHNIPWLTAIPEHWGIARSKVLFRPRKELARVGDQQLSATQAYGVIPQEDYEKRIGRKVTQVTRHLEKRRHVEEDDFVISMRSFQGGLERAWATGCIRSSYVVMQPSDHVDVGYFSYLFKSHDYIQALRATANFIRDGQDLNFNNFCLVDLPLVPMNEQKAIAKYLGHADRHIRRYIRAKRQLINLLNEQKQAIIHRGVTRGLDPSVSLKSSGVEWLGDLPEHWGCAKIKDLARTGYKTFTDGDWIESPYIRSEGIRLIQTGNIGRGEYREKGFRYIDDETFAKFGCTEVAPGDVLICRLGDPVARACRAPELGCRMITSVDVCILKLRDDVSADFVVHAMSSTPYLHWVSSLVRGSTRDRVSRKMLGSFCIPMPPPTEQIAIAKFLCEQTAEVVMAISAAQREIGLMREYRSRLIADVVTGKLDVGEAAARLPEEIEDGDTVSDDVLDEDIADDAELDTEPEEVEA